MVSRSLIRIGVVLVFVSMFGAGVACGGGDGERGVCEEIADLPEDVGSPVELRFVNVGSTATFVREVYACTGQWFELRQGEAVLEEGPGMCDTCRDVSTGMGCGTCSVVACLGLGFVRIEPGATFTVTWPGALFETTTWPAECAYDPAVCADAPTECVAPRAAPAGSYSVRVVQAFAPMCGGAVCECPDGAATCKVSTALYDGFEDLVLPLQLPRDDGLEFRLQ